MFLTFLLALPLFTSALHVQRHHKPTKIVLTNDDGWAVAQIRSEYVALKAAGYEVSLEPSHLLACANVLQVILSAPAQDKSGTGSTAVAVPTTLTIPCEYESCPVGSPGVGFNASDRKLHYISPTQSSHPRMF